MVKILTKVVVKRMTTQLDKRAFFSKSQAGFRARGECMAQVIALKELSDRRRARGEATYVGFIDIRKAFDTVPNGALLRKLSVSWYSR